MSSKPHRQRSLVRRMGFMLLGMTTLFYALIVIGIFVGGNFLIERNLEKQARHLMPIFDEISVPLFFSSGSNAVSRIENYASPISDIGLVRIYDQKYLILMAQYRKPEVAAVPPLDLPTLHATLRQPPLAGQVRRIVDASGQLRLLSPIQVKTTRSDVMDFGTAAATEAIETTETIGYIEIGMDFAPSHGSVYPALLSAIGVLTLALWIGGRAYLLRMRRALQPLLDLQAPLQRIAKGDFDATVDDGEADREVEFVRNALRTTIQALKQRERERNEAVISRIQADQANLAKSAFLANMSHEIRTPMNGVIGMLELLHDSRLSGAQLEFAGAAQASAESLLGLINEILDFSKVEAGKLTLEQIPFDLLQEVEAVSSAQAVAAQAKGLDLIVHYPPVLPRRMLGDPARIRQILMNLISNAIKFTARGHVLVEVKIDMTGPAQQQNRCHLHVTVIDTGIGLAGDQLDKVFEKFTQGDVSTTRQYGGTGLGLAICKQLTELMGGSIGVSSRLGHGTRFWFTLELPLAPANEVVPQASVLTGMRVLFVDEHPANRRVLEEQFLQLGMRADGYDTAAQALTALARAAATDPYRIAILDHKMSDIDGTDLAAAIKAQAGGRAIHLIMLSALSRASDAEQIAAAGFSAFLSKPVPQQMLSEVLHQLCRAIRNNSTLPFLTAATLAGKQALQPTETLSFAGSRVLVADDNLVNQQVAVRMLQRLGCQVDIAINGLQAVAMLHRQAPTRPYHLVLMDCQMPELDGYLATAQIRASAGPGATVAIVALTAHALPGEREKCLAAGMDDYLSKPIRPHLLREVLARWLAPQNWRAASEADAALSQQQQGQAAQQEYATVTQSSDELETVRRVLGDHFPEIVGLFRTHTPQSIAALRAAHNVKQLADIAHTLSGSCASMGASDLSQLCQELEHHARQETLQEPWQGAWQEAPEQIAARINAIEAEYGRIQIRLEAMCRRSPSGNQSDPD